MYFAAQLTLPNHIWKNTLPANIRKLVFSLKKSKGNDKFCGIHDMKVTIDDIDLKKGNFNSEYM